MMHSKRMNQRQAYLYSHINHTDINSYLMCSRVYLLYEMLINYAKHLFLFLSGDVYFKDIDGSGVT